VKRLVFFAIVLSTFLAACATGGQGEGTYYGNSLDCQAIASSRSAGTGMMPPGCFTGRR